MNNFNAKDFYEEKIQYFLDNNYEEYRPFDFYRDMFPVGSFQQANERGMFKPNGLLQYRSKEHHSKVLITLILNDELSELGPLVDKWPGYENVEFSTISGCSFVGKNKKKLNARMCHALIFDIDAVNVAKLRNIIGMSETKLIPTPTAITVSGNGVHLVYMLSEPIPLYPAKAFKIKTAAQSKSEKHYPFSQTEIDKLWDSSETDMFIQLVLMGIYSGCRFGEIIKLKKVDVCLEKNYFEIKQGKNKNAKRFVPIHNKTKKFWENWMEYSISEYLIVRKKWNTF